MPFSRLNIALLAIVSGVGLAACATTDKSASRDSGATATAGPDTAKPGGMAGMPGMSGTQGMMHSNAMMDSTRTDMQVMSNMGPDQMAAMLPAYSQTVTTMLSQMTNDMQTSHVSPDATWNALADSVRQDIARFPALTKPQLKQAMPAHHARVTRLMEMHTSMMAKTGR